MKINRWIASFRFLLCIILTDYRCFPSQQAKMHKAECVFMVNCISAAGSVPRVIKSIFQELQSFCRVLPAALKTGGGLKRERVVLENESADIRNGDQGLQEAMDY